MEPQASLIGADGAVELAAVAGVGVVFALVVLPGDPEGEHPLRLYHAVQQVGLLILGVLLDHGLQGGEDLFYGLDELRFVAMLLFDIFNNTDQVRVHSNFSFIFVKITGRCMLEVKAGPSCRPAEAKSAQAKNFWITETTSAPTRAWASRVAAPM